MKSFIRAQETLKPKKHLGQVFLKDERIVKRIIESCHLTKADSVLEIGPGPGTLTYKLADTAKDVTAVETDKRFVESLKKNTVANNIKILHADFLKVNLAEFSDNLTVVGNLPYYITSPIIQKLIENKKYFKRFFLTVQLEFGRRMTANPGTKDYSALTCFVKYHTDTKMLFQIKRGSFSPIPKVDSCFMELTVREKPEIEAGDEQLLFRIIHLAFQQRRKKLVNTLERIIQREKLESILHSLNIGNQLRPENLTVSDFVRIANLAKENP